MKARHLVLTVVGVAVLSGAAWAQGDMGKGMMMGGGDAKVTKEQFLKQAEERFGRMDANKDGVIDASDRKKMHERMRECREMMSGMSMMGAMRRHTDSMGKSQGDAAHHPAP